jgi:ketosteroid isomerase-like protein
MTSEDEAAALAAIDAIIDDFGNNRPVEYFAGFAPDATFLFHTSPARLESRAEYEALWAQWVAEDDFAVVSCVSTNRRIQIFGDTAIFTHNVETVLSLGGALETAQERESIIMQRRHGHWVCVHEHLSGIDA